MIVNGVEPGSRLIRQLLFSSSVMGAPPRCLLRYHMNVALNAFSFEQEPQAIVFTWFYNEMKFSFNNMVKFYIHKPECVLLERWTVNCWLVFQASLAMEIYPKRVCWWMRFDCQDLERLDANRDDCIPKATKRFDWKRPTADCRQRRQCNCQYFSCSRWNTRWRLRIESCLNRPSSSLNWVPGWMSGRSVLAVPPERVIGDD